ncbi:MAG: DUF2785 domain-containing protein [Ahniella sp.]|nr:DUF2785 domain-containing protein [Ahniella sp.]
MFHRFLLMMLLLSGSGQAVAEACPPEGWDKPSLVALKARQFVVDDADERARLAETLVPCLADPDPELRDGVAYEAMSTWLRAEGLASAQVQALSAQLLAQLEHPAVDPEGVAQPFAALLLSELARTDRINPHFPDALRNRMLHSAEAYVAGMTDYRGFEEGLGWRHGVAHGADWIMQLALNPAYDRAALERLRAALLSQVPARGEHAYTDGESERLARAILVLMHRSELDPVSWHQTLATVSAPAPLPDWAAAFMSRRGLNQRHNVRLFLLALNLGVQRSTLADREALLHTIDAAIKASD